MKFELTVQWHFCDKQNYSIDSELFKLLASIKETGSLQKTCQNLELSYRYSWGLLNRWEGLLKTRLILKRRGRGQGTHLTQQGELLLACYQEQVNELRKVLSVHEKKIDDTLKTILLPEKIPELEMHASHDTVIETMLQLLNQNPHQFRQIELKTMGSLRTLEHLLEGRCHIAGFHLPLNKKLTSVSKVFKPLLEQIESPLLQICNRTQGMLVQPGNPKNIRSIDDLKKNNLRLINRQTNSGSRLLLDTLLAEHSIKSSEIKGYNQVEFTHGAVAAMIASDAADVGFANQAAAERFKLDFIPCIDETYLLAFDPNRQQQTIHEIQSLLKSKVFSKKTEGISGYDFSACGKLLTKKSLLKKLF